MGSPSTGYVGVRERDRGRGVCFQSCGTAGPLGRGKRPEHLPPAAGRASEQWRGQGDSKATVSDESAQAEPVPRFEPSRRAVSNRYTAA